MRSNLLSVATEYAGTCRSVLRSYCLFNTGGPCARMLHLFIMVARSSTKDGKEIQNVEARINSLKVLALTLLREVEYLEEQDANSTPVALDLQTEVHRFEAEMIRSALIRTGGRQRRAARLLGMKTTTLNTKIKRYHIEGDVMKVKTKVKAGDGNGLDPHGVPKP